MSGIRTAARALILIGERVLLVNAFRAETGIELWCAPGGGAERGEALTDTLRREVHEETGLTIRPGALAGVSEFHNAATGFHQLDLFFHASAWGRPTKGWEDPEGIVSRWILASRSDLATLTHKPHNLIEMAFDRPVADYHGLHPMVSS